MNVQDIERSARDACGLLAALSNERRLVVLCQLVEGEKSVGELRPLLGLSQSALSQHLARLRRDGLVETRRQSQTIFYRLASPEARRIIETLYDLYCRPPTETAVSLCPTPE